MRAAVASRRLGLFFVAAGAIGGGSSWADSKAPARPDPVAQGYEIFNREWMPNDPRAHGGDGLGPVFNDSSCIACHNAGGGGGGGPVSKNIDILSASRNTAFMAQQSQPQPQPSDAPADPAAGFAQPTQAVQTGGACPPPSAAQLEPLFEL